MTGTLESARRVRVPTLLAATTVGVYLLILVGVTNALASATSACPTWPLCGGRAFAGADLRLLVVVAHRLATVVVAGLLAWTAYAAWVRGVSTRVAVAIGAAAVLYPLEVWIGAVTVLAGDSTAVSATHLVVAIGIFSSLLAGLVWQLETETETESNSQALSTDEATPTTGSRAGSEPEPGVHPLLAGPIGGRVWAYVRLTKPKLWWLLCLVAFAAMGLAAGRVPPLPTVVGTFLGGVLAIGASGTFNHVIERDVDKRMARTSDRPVAQAQIPVRRALAFGVAQAVASVGVFLALVNPLSAALGLLAVVFYSVVYTVVLKPNTPQNIVIGGAVGAFPALIGWAAVTDTVGVPAVVLGAVIFLWTPAHFYNLALVYRDDYARAGFPMLPVVSGESVTRRHILGYLGATMLSAVLLVVVTPLDWPFALVAVAVGAVFLWSVVRLYRERTDRAAFRAFMASNAYLGLLLLAIVVDSILV